MTHVICRKRFILPGHDRSFWSNKQPGPGRSGTEIAQRAGHKLACIKNQKMHYIKALATLEVCPGKTLHKTRGLAEADKLRPIGTAGSGMSRNAGIIQHYCFHFNCHYLPPCLAGGGGAFGAVLGAVF